MTGKNYGFVTSALQKKTKKGGESKTEKNSMFTVRYLESTSFLVSNVASTVTQIFSVILRSGLMKNPLG